MAYKDHEAFLRERGILFDPSLDVNPGSPYDINVVQPMLRRLGTDPFTTDITTFVNDRMVQAYPDLATKEGDTLTDLLNKPVTLLFDPLIRENTRVVRNLSFKDPASLTLDEADALGANYYSNRRTGDYSKGVARIFFNAAQDVTVSSINFLTSRTGLHFFPRTIQSIRAEEMILNYDNQKSLYYFDINCVAEKPGTAYNIEPGELFSIANVASAVRVDNLRRFQFGETEESAEEFVSRIQQELSERSLVTLRGIASKILENFPEVTRLNVVGFNDPEMQRDVIKGGGLGAIVASGIAGSVIADGEGAAYSRRFYTTEVNFTTLIGGAESSWYITIFECFGTSVVKAYDFAVKDVKSANELDLEEQTMVIGSSNCRWTLRKKELTLSSIPGGIIFPDSANGTVSIPDNQIHIGGTYDVHVRGSSFDDGTLVLANVTDDEPLLSGVQLIVEAGTPNVVKLTELVLGTDYDVNDATYNVLRSAELLSYTLRIMDGPSGVVGNYRILSVTQLSGLPPTLTLTPEPSNPGLTEYRWQVLDAINVDLIEPKETLITGSDLRTLQGSAIVDTTGGTNFDTYGAAEGDTLRILNGPNTGDYSLVADPLSPSFEKLQLDRNLARSGSGFQYILFRPNTTGGLLRPLVRITKVELLDTSSQPLGSTIPYAKPVDIQSRAFQNPARGVKHDFRTARVGLTTIAATWTGGQYKFLGVTVGQTLQYTLPNVLYYASVVITNNDPTPAQLAADINASTVGSAHPSAAFVIGQQHVGIRPLKGGVFCIGGSAMVAIYGGLDLQSTFDVRTSEVTDWTAVSPEIDLTSGLDVVQVVDGYNLGFYEAPYLVNQPREGSWPGAATASKALMVNTGYDAGVYNNAGFSPEVDRRVQIGARSLGSARVFFLEPTSFEVDADTRFRLETDEGDLYFLPDPTLTYERIPAQPSGVQPDDGVATVGADTFDSASQDFVLSGIVAGDILKVENRALGGTVILPNPVPSLVYRTLVFSLDGGPDRTVTFIRDDSSLDPDEVSRSGVVDQINGAAGEDICQLTATNTLEFHTKRDIVIRATGTANMPDPGDVPPFPGLLDEVADTGGAEDFSADQNNTSPMAGEYVIDVVGQTQLTVTPGFSSSGPYPSPLTRQTFRVLRKGVQRIVATAMADNTAEAGLYYFDVELVSEGSGDSWNIASSQQLTATGYRSDGYYLITSDENLAFSDAEPVKMVLSRTILEQGVDDDPANATQLSAQNIQVSYERAGVVGDIQNFVSSETERVVCSSPLGRHLLPHFVRFDMSYAGGAEESVIVPEMESFIRKVFPQSALESSDLQKIVLDNGANSITNPIDLIAIVHYADRSVYATRSQDSLTTGRLAAFIPDVLDVTRRVS